MKEKFEVRNENLSSEDFQYISLNDLKEATFT